MPIEIDGVRLTEEKQIRVEGGDVFHAMKSSSAGYEGFGEVYFSFVEEGVTKGWKKHKSVTLNIVVPVGAIRFVIFDDRGESPTRGAFMDISLSSENYKRLTVPPGLWMAFRGVSSGANILVNIIDSEHSPDESVAVSIRDIPYIWEKPL